MANMTPGVEPPPCCECFQSGRKQPTFLCKYQLPGWSLVAQFSDALLRRCGKRGRVSESLDQTIGATGSAPPSRLRQGRLLLGHLSPLWVAETLAVTLLLAALGRNHGVV